MSTTGIIGTLTLKVDEGENEQLVASLLSCRLTFETEMLPALNPDVYGWEYFVPGDQDWRGEASLLQLIDDVTLAREEYLQLLEQYFMSKTLLAVEFESPAGVSYEASGYIDTFDLGGAENEAYSGNFGIQGITALTIT